MTRHLERLLSFLYRSRIYFTKIINIFEIPSPFYIILSDTLKAFSPKGKKKKNYFLPEFLYEDDTAVFLFKVRAYFLKKKKLGKKRQPIALMCKEIWRSTYDLLTWRRIILFFIFHVITFFSPSEKNGEKMTFGFERRCSSGLKNRRGVFKKKIRFLWNFAKWTCTNRTLFFKEKI